MKKRTILLLLLSLIILIGNCVGCSSGQSKGSEDDPHEFYINPHNFEEYFNIEIKGDIDYTSSYFGGTIFTVSATVSCHSLVTMSLDHVVIEGLLQLPLEKTHLLYLENKLPLRIKLVLDGSGNAVETASFSHGEGHYGGYSVNDFYFECTSASGTIKLH